LGCIRGAERRWKRESVTTALDAIPIFSVAPQGGVLPNLTGTKTADGGSSFHSLYSSLQSQAAQEIHEAPESASSSDDASPTTNTNTKNLTTVAGGFSGKPKAPQSVAAGSNSNLPQAVTSLPVPPILPQPLLTFPEPLIANQPISALQLSASATSVPALSTMSASQSGNQTGNQIQSQTMTSAVPPIPSVPITIANPPIVSEQNLSPQIQVPSPTAVTSPVDSNAVPISAPTPVKIEDPSPISAAPQTITYSGPSFSRTASPQTSSLQTPSVQTPAPQQPSPQASSISMPSLQASALPTPDIQTPRVQTPAQTSASAATSPALTSEQPASLVPYAYSIETAAQQAPLNVQAVNTAFDSSTILAFADTATTNPATANSQASTLQDTALIATNSMLPQLAAPSPVPASASDIGNSAPAQPEATATTNQPQPVPSNSGNPLISALMAPAPTTAIHPVIAAKNNLSTTATAGALLPTLRSSPSQMPSNDSTNLQNELSLASAVVFPAPSSNQPSVHTLVNSAALPVTAAAHSAVGSSTSQNPPNAPGSKVPTTSTPSSPMQVSPSSKSTSASTTATDSSTDHSQPASTPAIQLASQQPVPTPAAPNATVAATTTVLPTSNADPAVASHPQLPATAPPTANTSNAAAELPPATLPNPGPVQMAQMVTRATQSEMRIGLNTSAFGSVEVRTVVHAGDVGLSVGSEKGDLHSLLSNELPTIANSLQQQSLRLTQVSFHQGSGLSGNLSSGGGSQQQRFTSPTPSGAGWSKDESPEISTEADDSYSLSRGAGLSILA